MKETGNNNLQTWRTATFAGIGIAFSIIASCSRSGADSKELLPCEITAPLDSLFSNIFNDSDAPGAVVMVQRGDTIKYSHAFGKARINDNLPLSDSVKLNIASATKTFVTAGLLMLQEQGKLHIDSTLAHFFPEFKSPVFRKITLRHVLYHSTGLPDLRPRTPEQWDEYVKDHLSAFALGPDFMLYGREEELAQFFETVDCLEWEPGSRFEYQNAPYMLISKIVERTTGITFETWMQHNVFDPAKLTETKFFEIIDNDPMMAHGYTPVEDHCHTNVYHSPDGLWEECDYGEAEFFLTRADNGIYTTPREFMRWIHMLHHGEIISDSILNETNQVFINTGLKDIGYGLGLYVQDIPGKPKKVFHNTSNGGFAIFEATFPKHDIYYSIFANRPDWNRLETARKVDSILTVKGWLPTKEHIDE